MRVTVDAAALKDALKRLQPSRRYKSMQETFVTATAGGSALVFIGTLDSSASVEAIVHNGGSVQIPLGMAVRLLGTYKRGARVEIRSEQGAVYFDKVRFSVD